MKPTLRIVISLFLFSLPLLTTVTGCNTADNPKMAEAPPPPAAKPEEKKE